MKLAALIAAVLVASLLAGCANVMPQGAGEERELQQQLRQTDAERLPYPRGVHGGIL
ncbi:hypothetical protein [Lignipirellula cremea]|uniref:Lipoprotein n=1 Tax=Lignipirellula cremea TaxID=2528010 RepID=A0A518E1F8_9BACT|nr:hypothetical protein [Lignipirellula cremea]QDU97903.1 hypothetical protein Pla8534_57610 [Lignipirellula cremea]